MHRPLPDKTGDNPDLVLAPADLDFNAFLAQPGHQKRIRHVAVFDGNRLMGVLRVNTALRHALAESQSDVSLRDVASRDFTVVREGDIVFDVILEDFEYLATEVSEIFGDGVSELVELATGTYKVVVLPTCANEARAN